MRFGDPMPSPFDNPMDSLFSIFAPIMLFTIALLVIGIMVFVFIKVIGQWQYNNKQPVLTVDALIRGKRTNTHTHSNLDNSIHHSSTSNQYYITFEVESGDRMEFLVPSEEYGLLMEGDKGRLTFQGSRYLGFNRKKD